jgi:TonB-linked SusC/RagA family outer membrane protein
MGRFPTRKRFTFLITLFVLSTMFSSAQKVSLNFSGQNLRTVLESITEQTDYSLAYSKEAVDLSDAVSINVTDADLSQVLNELLASRNIGYEVRDNKIYIFDRPQAASQVAQGQQQEVTIRGMVLDDEGEPIIGANIVVPGTTIGTVTDVDGNYTINIPRGSSLRFSFIGYVDQVFVITNQTSLNVRLIEDSELLDELVVVGYGVQRKSVVTAAISQVTAEELNVTRPTRVEDALKGKVSGVQITQSSGQPGSDSKVRIRGIGTINNSEPLYIVDGMEVGGGISYLNPVDIASVEILKDAASAAIYGSRAANGVILVTTKKGATGKATINYDVSYGWQNPWKKREILNAGEYMVIMNESRLNDGNLPLFNAEQMSSAGNGTDWQDETFYYNAPVQNHQVSVSGGTEKANYFLSFGYFDQAGIVGGNYDKSNYKRYSLRSNSIYNIFETKDRSFFNNIDLGVNVGYSRDKSTGIETNSEYGSILGSALTFSPLVPVYADEETAASILAQYPFAVKNGDKVFSIPPSGFQEIANPVAMLHQPSAGLNNSDKLVGSVWAELTIIPELKFRSSYGFDLAFWGYDAYSFPYFLAT